MIRTLSLTLLLVALLPIGAAAQSTPDQRLDAARAAAASAGIPLELLENRIAEGRAKGVPEARIADAIERRARGLAQAREAMVAAGVRPNAAELSSGADAMEAGVDAQSLRAVIQAARAEDRPVALAVLGELVRQGIPVQEARDRVRTALARREANLGDLPRRTAAERAAQRQNGAAGARPGAGRQPGAAAAGAGQGGRPAGVPATGRPGGTGGGNGNGGGGGGRGQ